METIKTIAQNNEKSPGDLRRLAVTQDPSANECCGSVSEPSDDAVPIFLELLGIWSTFSLPLLPGQLWSRVFVAVTVKLFVLYNNPCGHLTLCKRLGDVDLKFSVKY